MIVTRLYGGLGNQMFQYAAGRRLALIHGLPLYLDLRWFDTQSKRRFELAPLDIDATILTDEDWKCLDVPPLLLTETAYHFDASVLRAPDHCLLDGYWQSPRYFADIEPVIRADFQPSGPPTDFELETATIMTSAAEPAAVHVRRGDYVSDPQANTFHGVCGPGYYRQAMSVVRASVPDARFFVFSDDPEWVEENLPAPDVTTVRAPEDSKPFESMRLMSLARHHVIANSSYSWWGSWLASKDDRCISIAPRPWFADLSINTDDLIPPHWTTVACG